MIKCRLLTSTILYLGQTEQYVCDLFFAYTRVGTLMLSLYAELAYIYIYIYIYASITAGLVNATVFARTGKMILD